MSGKTGARPTVSFKTLGCRLNSAETDALKTGLVARGFAVVDTDTRADYVIINTCTVTDNADGKNRYYIRRAARDWGGQVVVTGCFAQTDGAEIAAMPGVALVVDNLSKGQLPARLAERHFGIAPGAENASNGPLWRGADHEFAFSPPQGHTRAYLKIQDGCNKTCAYCKIPQARGAARSARPALVVDNFLKLARLGVPEVVLTGVNLGWYRHSETENRKSLPALLRQLLDLGAGPRLRISSIEPGDITPTLLEVVAGHPDFCPFFHVPLQSGDGRILRLMRRGYSPDNFSRRVDIIRSFYTRAGIDANRVHIGSDLIVGYPGETHAEFRASLELARRLRLGGLHVFPFSRRRGTRADELPNADFIDPAELRARVAEAAALARELRRDFAAGFDGLRVEGIGQRDATGNYYLSGEYLRLVTPASDFLPGGRTVLRVTGSPYYLPENDATPLLPAVAIGARVIS